MRFIHDDFVGKKTCFQSPFGQRPILYADSGASGRLLTSIETYMQTQVMPSYANTHSSASHCGIQTTQFCHEARELIKHAVNGSEKDVVIFVELDRQELSTSLCRFLAWPNRQVTRTRMLPTPPLRYLFTDEIAARSRRLWDLSWRMIRVVISP